jgi:hypothetical protein
MHSRHRRPLTHACPPAAATAPQIYAIVDSDGDGVADYAYQLTDGILTPGGAARAGRLAAPPGARISCDAP